VLVGGTDRNKILFDRRAMPGGTPIHIPAAPAAPASLFIFSPDSHWLASVSEEDATLVRLYDLSAATTGEEKVVTLAGHTGNVSAIAFTPDSRRLITGSDDKTARLWDLAGRSLSNQPVILVGHQAGIFSIAVSADSHWVATGGRDDTVRLWDLSAKNPAAESKVLWGLESVWCGPYFGIDSIAFSPDGRWLIGKGYELKLRLWDLQSGHFAAIPLLAVGSEIEEPNRNPDKPWGVTRVEGNRAYVAAVGNAQQAPPPRGPTSGTLSAGDILSPDQRWRLSRKGYSAELWGPKAVKPLKLQDNQSARVQFSGDSRWFVTSAQGNKCDLWDLAASIPTHRGLDGDTCSVDKLAFSPDSKWLATLSKDVMLLWEIGSKDAAAVRIDTGWIPAASGISFSADGP